jgi:hypothetical protein
MNIPPNHQFAILTHNSETIGALEGLLAIFDTTQQRTEAATVKYKETMEKQTLFSPKLMNGLHGIFDMKFSNDTLKQCVVDWMTKYTNNAASALFVAKLAKNAASQIN